MDGRTIAGRYALESLLGRGGMGEVWAAVDMRIEREVAVKLLPEQPGTDSTELFLREARTAGGLAHAGVVTIHDLGQDDDGTFYLVMERITGRDLAQVLRAEGPLAIADVVGWSAQIADALAAAHDARVVHRDLKPANVMLTTGGAIKILDFGIARYTATATQASRIIGTPQYMPPERLLGKAGDGRGDLYSLGCMLHELLTGATPFGGLDTAALMFAHIQRDPEAPSSRRPDIPTELDQLVLDLLAKDPDERPAAAAQVRDRLNSLSITSAATTAPAIEAAPKPVQYTPTVADAAPAAPAAPAPDDSAPTETAQPSAVAPIHTTPTQGPPPRPAQPAGIEPAQVRTPQPDRQDTLAAQPPEPERTPSPAARPQQQPPSRRRFLLLSGIGAAALVGTTTAYDLGAWRQDEPTTRAGAGAHRTSTPSAKHKTAPTSTSSPKSQASRTPGPWSAAGGSGAFVDNGLVYVPGDAGIHAFDAATGDVKWKPPVKGGSGTFYIEAIVDRKVIARDDNNFYALDGATGEAIWKIPLDRNNYTLVQATRDLLCYYDGVKALMAIDLAKGKKGKPISGDESSVTCDRNRIIVTGKGAIMGYAASGARVWKAESEDSGAPKIVNGKVYSLTESGLHAIDAASGNQSPVMQGTRTFAAIVGSSGHDLFVCDNDNKLYTVDTRKLSITHTWDISIDINTSDMFGGSRATYFCDIATEEVAAFDTTTGNSWTQKVKNVDSVLAASSSFVYVTSGDQVHVLDVIKGTPMTQFAASGDPLITKDCMYFVDGENVVALDLETAKARWRQYVGDADSVAAVGSNRVIVTGIDQTRIYALSADTGTPPAS
ncbi:protein kinase [Streptomyces adustus]|uniref:non-specific serine/threonine protein kinase n=1 Tax=Streptomyces adustus TaxID=1609272 RepID=A0A5N8VRH3_9ACTN|nr:protein kinase [Streptomyces adustus]MPY37549.1 protein kinase [Streptomyces adustus]